MTNEKIARAIRKALESISIIDHDSQGAFYTGMVFDDLDLAEKVALEVLQEDENDTD